jgi:hypothetical protein
VSHLQTNSLHWWCHVAFSSCDKRKYKIPIKEKNMTACYFLARYHSHPNLHHRSYALGKLKKKRKRKERLAPRTAPSLYLVYRHCPHAYGFHSTTFHVVFISHPSPLLHPCSHPSHADRFDQIVEPSSWALRLEKNPADYSFCPFTTKGEKTLVLVSLYPMLLYASIIFTCLFLFSLSMSLTRLSFILVVLGILFFVQLVC